MEQILLFERPLAPVKISRTEIDPNLKCKGWRKAKFTTLKGLGGHYTGYKAAIMHDIENEQEKRPQNQARTASTGVFKQSNTISAELMAITWDYCSTHPNNNEVTNCVLRNDALDQLSDKSTFGKVDDQKRKKGSAVRYRYSNIHKYQHIVVCQSWIDA